MNRYHHKYIIKSNSRKMFRKKNKPSYEQTTYYDSDAVYRQQSIFGSPSGLPYQGGNQYGDARTGYVPPSMGYQPPTVQTQQREAEVGYRPPLFPGSAELAEVVPEPEEEEPEKKPVNVVLAKSLQNIANSLLNIQKRANRSNRSVSESENEKSIKNLFSERIVKGRPDLFVPSTPIPTSPVESSSTPLPAVLQSNISGFFTQFLRSDSKHMDEDKWSKMQREFSKRFNRSDAEYLRTAAKNFCEETRRMYSYLLSNDYVSTPIPSPTEEEPALLGSEGVTPATPTPRTESVMEAAKQQPIEDRIHSFIDALLAEIRKHKAWRGVDEDGFRDTRDCIERLLLESLREYTLGHVRSELKKDDEELEAKLVDLQFLSMSNLDVSSVCIENEATMEQVKVELMKLTNLFSPAEKLDCIIEACRMLGALLQSGNKSGNDAGADDFLPAFIYIVLKSNIPKLPSTVEYISRFRHPDELLSEGGYCLTNLSGAVSFLQNCGGCDFDIDPDEYERHVNKYVPKEEEEEEDLLCF